MMYTSPMIEKIIKSPSAQKALSSISPIYAESFVGLWLLEVIGRQLDDLEKWGEEYKDQVVPYTAAWSIPYWEEQFGLLSSETLTIEQRRNAVVARIQTRAPINPEKLGRIASLAAGVEVKIVEQPGEYQFRVEMTDPSGVYNKKALCGEIDLRKPAHLIYAIVIRMIGIAWNDYRFTLDRMRISAKIRFYYPDVVRLDGERILNGSFHMDNREAGTYFNMQRAVFEAGIRNAFTAWLGSLINVLIRTEYRSSFGMKIGFTAENPNRFRDERIRISVNVQNENRVPVTLTKDSWWSLDGTYSLDGEKRMNAAIIKEEF